MMQQNADSVSEETQSQCTETVQAKPDHSVEALSFSRKARNMSFLKLYALGMSQKEIALKHECSRNTVSIGIREARAYNEAAQDTEEKMATLAEFDRLATKTLHARLLAGDPEWTLWYLSRRRILGEAEFKGDININVNADQIKEKREENWQLGLARCGYALPAAN